MRRIGLNHIEPNSGTIPVSRVDGGAELPGRRLITLHHMGGCYEVPITSNKKTSSINIEIPWSISHLRAPILNLQDGVGVIGSNLDEANSPIRLGLRDTGGQEDNSSSKELG
jgi:hypothetical protein